MLCAVLKGPTFEEARNQLVLAQDNCTLVELRLDFFEDLDLNELRKLRQEFRFPMIFTLRPISQGGSFKGSEEERLEKIRELSTLQPEYIDLEYTVNPTFVKKLRVENPQIHVIISFHDFEKTPPLSSVLEMLKKFEADLYKIAVMVHSSSEALSLLTFMRENQPNVLVMGMGPYGNVTRILSPLFGGRFVYASLDQELSTAPGQVSLKQLATLYHYNDLMPSTAIYGLIGDPVNKSLGYITHNAVMHEFKLPSVYVNFPVTKEELTVFIKEAKRAGLAGLSVTMPLKEDIIPLLNEIDSWAQMVGAVNTLHFNKGSIKGYNTDGKGALDAIEEKVKVKGKKIVFIGAGGATKAVAKEALERGATVVVLNRQADRALLLSEQISCHGGGLDELALEYIKGYDILINATPDPMPIAPEFILENSIVMDFNSRPVITTFLEEAKRKKCTLVYGYEMFSNQAAEQFKIWFGDEIPLEKVKSIIAESITEFYL